MRNCLYYVTLFSIICHSREQSNCNREPPNTCCYNHYLNEDNNTCTECPYGSYGWNCKLSCVSGYYGRLCSFPCECDASECHHVTGCTTTIDPQYVTTSATDATSHYNLLTIANVTGEVSTYQGVKLVRETLHIHYEDDHASPMSALGFSLLGSLSSLWFKEVSTNQGIQTAGENLHIHYEDEHASPMSALGFSVLGSLSSLCIIGCVLFIRSRKKKWKFRGSFSFSKTRHVLLPCVNQDRQRTMAQGNIELSNVNRAPVCGQEEDDSPYSDIRYSQFIGGTSTGGACINTASCTMHECDSDKYHNTSEKQNIYQMSMGKNEYDRVNLKVKSSDLLSDRNLSLTHSNVEEYVSLSNTPSHVTCKEVRTKDDLKCQNLTLPKNTTTEMGKSESEPHRLLTEYSLQKLEFDMGVKVDQLLEKTNHQSVDTGRQTGPQSVNRPYSMAGGLSDNGLSETVEESSNLQDINMSENKHLSENDLCDVVENSVNPLDIDIDIPGKRENTSRMEDNSQTNARPYSIAKIPEF